jgi:hypothetical protein
MKSIMTAALMVLAITTAGAAEDPRFSANYLFPDCKAFAEEPPGSPLNFRMGRCAGIIEGLVYLRDNSSALGFCVAFPATVSLSQAARVVVRYIEARPQRMHESFARLAMEALHDGWPCGNGR